MPATNPQMSSRFNNDELVEMAQHGDADAFDLLADRVGFTEAQEMMMFGETLN